MELQGVGIYSRGSHIRHHGRAHDAHSRVNAPTRPLRHNLHALSSRTCRALKRATRPSRAARPGPPLLDRPTHVRDDTVFFLGDDTRNNRSAHTRRSPPCSRRLPLPWPSHGAATTSVAAQHLHAAEPCRATAASAPLRRSAAASALAAQTASHRAASASAVLVAD
jgi:hypothetical protein